MSLQSTIVLMVATFFIGASAMAIDNGSGPSGAAAAELIALEQQFAQALTKGDVDALEKIVDPDWMVIGPDGKVITRSAFFDVVKSGALSHSSMELDETRVRFYGDTAIVTARALTTGSYQGHPFTTRERSTDVFVRQHGQWKYVLTQLTTIAEK
jgi:ketosteroid isomerase-like protein